MAQFFDPLPQRRDALRLELRGSSFGNHIAALPVIASIDEDENLTPVRPAKSLLGIAGLPGQPEPKNIHRGTDFVGHKPRLAPDQ
jgi:hypothetical protein